LIVEKLPQATSIIFLDLFISPI